MEAETGPGRGSERPEEDAANPFAPPRTEDPLSKGGAGVAGAPTVTSMPGAEPPVGPPPAAPPGPPQSFGYGTPPGAASSPYGAGPGYGHDPYSGYGGGYAAYPGYPQPGGAWGGPPPSQGTAVAAMVLGIVGLVATSTCWGSFLGILVAPVALMLGISARRKADRGEAGGRGYATSGMVMGIVGTVLSAILIVALVLLIANAEDFESDTSNPGYYDALRSATATSVTVR